MDAKKKRKLQKVGGRMATVAEFLDLSEAEAHELEREGVGALLIELEEQLGPPSKADLARARKAWPKR